MKAEVKIILKEKGQESIFDGYRYKVCKDVMKQAMSSDIKMKMLLQISPEIRAEFIADQMIKLVTMGAI